MIRSYLAFARQNHRPLGFGVILMILSSPGQTFFISLFTDHFASHYAVGKAEIGGVFAAATFASALALPLLGTKIDSVPLRRFTLAVGGLLCLACAALAGSPPYLWTFALCVFALRLGGQGLMIHTAMTATVRAFPGTSGKALAVVSLLYSAAMTVIPALAVLAIGIAGWRGTWLLAGVAVAIGTLAAIRLLPPAGTAEDKSSLAKAETGAARPRLGLMLAACPVMLAVSFILTGLLFHQAALADEKGWPLEWLAGSFAAFALSQAATSLLAAPSIDRFGAVRILPFFLLPLVGALTLVSIFDGRWVAPVYMALLGVAAAVDLKLGTILWGELFGAAQLGYVRSRFEAIRIVVTGIAPLAVGWLLDLGIAFTQQTALYAAYALMASALAAALGRFVVRPQH